MKISRLTWMIMVGVISSLGAARAQELPQNMNVAHLYNVLLGSRGNVIELTVEDPSGRTTPGVKVVAGNLPTWVHLTPGEQVLPPGIKKGGVTARFTFSVDKTAPVNKEHALLFTVSTPQGGTWVKEIRISASRPDRFELFQNYPNPFNPQTTIEYSLAESKQVRLVVYDVLGQEIRTVVDGLQDAGFKSVVLNAGNLPSGVYFYRLQAGSFVEVKKLLLTK